MSHLAPSMPTSIARSAPHITRRTAYREGITAALPLLIGVMPFGVVYGALAVSSGFSASATGAMSAIVFAGSAQFLAVGLAAAHSSPVAIIVATFIINLRHVLYGAALGKQMRHLGPLPLLGLAFVTTDELFVLTQTRRQGLRRAGHANANRLPWFAAGTATLLYLSWQCATWLGIWGGAYVPDPTRWGLDFALAASFLAFLVPQLTTRPAWLCVTVAALAAILLRNLPLQSGLILAILLGVAAALIAERLSLRPFSGQKRTVSTTRITADAPPCRTEHHKARNCRVERDEHDNR